MNWGQRFALGTSEQVLILVTYTLFSVMLTLKRRCLALERVFYGLFPAHRAHPACNLNKRRRAM